MAEIAVSTLIGNLVPLLAGKANLLRGYHKEVASIKDELESIQSFLRDATVRAEINDGVNTWLKQVMGVSYHTEDILDEYILHLAEESQRCGFISILHEICRSIIKLKPRHEIASQILDIKLTIRDIKQRAERYGFSSLDQVSSSGTKDRTWYDPRPASLFIEDDEVVGIEFPRDELISRLMAGESKRVMISLVGMAGVGKTTLANIVYNNQIVTRHFDCCAWISVSQSYKTEDLFRIMIKQFHEARKDFAIEGIDTMEGTSLISKLRVYLQEKRYVVVFDNVWEVDFWRFIRDSLPNNNNGSRIIITTRMEDVASSCLESPLDYVHKVQPLPQKMAWDLFCKKVFRYGCPPELEKYSFDIVRKCEGLPLAIVAIGHVLSTKNMVVSEWQKFYNSFDSELERNPHLKSVTEIVLLSYHDLPYYLQSCFLYMGMIPEDYAIRCGRLIRLWIAEGFVKEQKGKVVEEVAEEHLTELIHRRLVQVSKVNFEGKAGICKVHNVVREIILSKSKKLSFCQVLSEEKSTFGPQTRRLSIHNSMNNVLKIDSNSGVRSVFLFSVSQFPESSLGELVTKFKLLRVLDLEGAPSDYLPERVGNLLCLRYLSVRNTKVKILPKSIGKLLNLQTLDLENSLVYELPNEINRLYNLRHLLAYYRNYEIFCLDSVRGVKMQKGIGRLEELQNLYYVEANHAEVGLIVELQNLRQLRKLGIKKLTREKGRALSSSIEKMEYLKSLEVSAITGDEILDLQSISSPPQFLQSLYLSGRLEKLPDWIPKLQNLVRLRLFWSGFREDPLKALQGLPNLLWLGLYQVYDGQLLLFQAGGFQKLKLLLLRALNELNSVTIEEGALPLLERLIIGPSPQLKEVPRGIHRLTELKNLEFYDMQKEFLARMLPDNGEDYWIVNHIPNVLFKSTLAGGRHQT